MTQIKISIDCDGEYCGDCMGRKRQLYYCDAFKCDLGIKITKTPMYKLQYKRCPNA